MKCIVYHGLISYVSQLTESTQNKVIPDTVLRRTTPIQILNSSRSNTAARPIEALGHTDRNEKLLSK